MTEPTRDQLERELVLIKALKQARKESDRLYAVKWVERAAIWLIALFAGSVVIGLAKIAVDAMLKVVGR